MIGSERFVVTVIKETKEEEIRETVYTKNKDIANKLIDNITKKVVNEIISKVEQGSNLIISIKENNEGLKGVCIRLVDKKKNITERKITVEAITLS